MSSDNMSEPGSQVEIVTNVTDDGEAARLSVMLDRVVEGDTLEQARRRAGYAPDVTNVTVSASPALIRAVKDHVSGRIRTEGAAVGFKTLKRLALHGKTEATQLNAAKYLLDAAGLGPASLAANPADVPLHEMTEDELRAVIEKAERGGPMPVVKIVEGESAQKVGAIPQGGRGRPRKL